MNCWIRRGFFIFCLTLIACLPAVGSSEWTQPTPEQLKMTSDPAAPDAPAVYLFREEIVDDHEHFHRVYAQVKILNEKGKEEFSDIEIPYEAGVANIREVAGRTIEPDGTVVPFTGKPYVKELVKTGGEKIMAKVFSMPNVQVGSILEYRWELQYDDSWFYPPDWIIPQDLFVHKAHYHFIPAQLATGQYMMVTDAMGKQSAANQLLYYQSLPQGEKVREGLDGYDLVVENIPPVPDEQWSPPLASFAYRVVFYYSPQFSGADFWKAEGKIWSKEVDRFADPSDRIRAAVAQIVAPGDSDEQKLQKIYAAVMTVENTRFTREHTAQENKAEGVQVKTAADIWQQKRGSDDEIARLFIAMARAAGMKAYAMIVTERNQNFLNTGYLNWGQLEDEIAIVNVGGKEVFFDPGQRYCEYGKLHWMHTEVLGIRQSDKGLELGMTPAAAYQDNEVLRVAELTMGPDGTVKGIVRISMTGVDALRWRQDALANDEQTAKRDFESQLQALVPPGVQVKMDHFIGLTDQTSALMAVVNVSGTMGTRTGKRVFLPAAFFQANARPLFPDEKRKSPVDLHYPYLARDQVTLTLPPGFTVESVPSPAEIPLPHRADYKAQYVGRDNQYVEARLMALGVSSYKVEDYSQLRSFFQSVSAQDQQQVVLKFNPTAVTAAVTGKGQ
ncbi:MAG: DUF3857 and transglutaminase domain-containing protein [Acidobacteriaceae bacterium]